MQKTRRCLKVDGENVEYGAANGAEQGGFPTLLTCVVLMVLVVVLLQPYRHKRGQSLRCGWTRPVGLSRQRLLAQLRLLLCGFF